MVNWKKEEYNYWRNEWKEVPGWPMYRVNRAGQVWSEWSQRVLKFSNTYSLTRVDDYGEHFSQRFYKDRLVYMTFDDVVYEIYDYDDESRPIYRIVFVNVPNFDEYARVQKRRV